MLATLIENYFSDKNWIYERKLEGERVIAFKKNNSKLYSGNKKLINNTYPEIKKLLYTEKQYNFIIDGKIVAFDKNLSFSKLQERIHVKDPDKAINTGIKVYYYAFDMLHIDKYDLRKIHHIVNILSYCDCRKNVIS